MLNEKKMPDYFWAEAVATAVYIMNRTPTVAVHGMTPEEKYTGKKPDFHILKYLATLLMFISLIRGELSSIQRQKNASSLDILCSKKGTIVITLPHTRCK